ncbi:MAG: DNA-processing protein DprA [Patescibacteria group bacterium]|jgi:DNA processing protein
MTDPFLVALANCPVFGSRTLEKLFAKFGTAQAIWAAPEHEFLELGIPESRLAGFFTFRQAARPDVYVKSMEQHGIRLITKDDTEYPALLKTIYDPPFALFIQGELMREQCVSIVGSRNLSEYGKKTARTFAYGLAAHGVSIVSGLALGIDTIAHKGAIEAKGHTTAVLGGGLLAHNSMDKENIAEKIIETGGTLVTEYGLHSPFLRFHFPMRNRIIAGMSRITLVVEAGLPSGSLLTAHAAINAGREVFAVPGPIDSLTSAGTNNLIKDGAFVATSPDDLLLAFGIATPRKTDGAPAPQPVALKKPLPELIPFHRSICAYLEHSSLFADELCLKTGSTASDMSRALLELELMGVVRSLGGTRYERV